MVQPPIPQPQTPPPPPPPPAPKGEIQQIHVNEDDSYFQDEAGQKFNRELVGQSGDDRDYQYTPIDYTPPPTEPVFRDYDMPPPPPPTEPVFRDYDMPPPPPPTQPVFRDYVYGDEPSNQPKIGNDMPPDMPPPPAPTIDTSNFMTHEYRDPTAVAMIGQPIDGGWLGMNHGDGDTGGGLAGMVQPPIPQPQTPPPPPPPPTPEVPTYGGSPIFTNEDGWQVYHDEDGRERRVPDEHPSDRAGGPIKAKKYAMGGIATLQTYAAGGKLLNGDGDGMSDSIPAVINGPRPQRAALADGEFVIPADVVSHLGNGSTKAGAKRLYQMMDKVRMARVGTKKQGKQINPSKFMPA